MEGEIKGMRICVLFGAGASAFSEPNNFPTPPLGENLFAELRQAGLISSDLNGEIREVFENEGFETGMSLLNQRTNRDYNPLLKATALFLSQFLPSKDNYYRTFISKISHRLNRFTIGTLNYDNLIEHSALNLGISISYSFAHRQRVLSVLKLHGSSGFVPDLGSNTITNFTSSGCDVDIEAPVKHLIDYEDIKRWCATDHTHSLAPVMSMYMRGKRTPVCRGEVNRQRSEWAAALRRAEICYVVGVKTVPEDTHIWDPLFESRCRIAYVNPDPRDFLELARERKRKYAFHHSNTFRDFVSQLTV